MNYYDKAGSYLEDLITRKPCRIFIAATGAGAGLQKKVWEVPGSSAILCGAVLPYAQDQLDEFLGFSPDNYCNEGAALAMALSAYLRADNGDTNKTPIGIGISASVATLTPHRGDHRIHVAAITPTGAYTSQVVVPKGGPEMRQRDGLIADTMGLEMLLLATGYVPIAAFHESVYEIQEASEKARQVLLDRPLFRSDGRREKVPEGQSLIFPGNFNPPHEGHFETGQAGAWHSGQSPLYQITANPPHKESLSLYDMLTRVRLFRGKGDVMFSEGGALYLEKARRFPESTFIVGTDALRRMLDPKWGPKPQELLKEFVQLGVSFLVSSRDDDDLSQVNIPPPFDSMFTQLPRGQYRHMSSTRIREGTA